MTSFTLTSAGTQAAIRAKEKAVALKFTKIVIGDAVEDTQNLKGRSKLKNQIQAVKINAAAHNKAKDQLELNVLIPFPKGRKDGFEVKEVGIYVEDPNDQTKEKLALIHSSDTAIARRSVGEDLFISIVIKLEGSDLAGVTIHEPTTDYSLLLKSTFDKYVLKANIAKTFTVQVEDNLVSSYELSKGLDGRLKKIEAEQKALDLGSFPRFFSPRDSKDGKYGNKVLYQKDYIVAASNTNGLYKFTGGEFDLTGPNVKIPAFETRHTKVSFKKPANIQGFPYTLEKETDKESKSPPISSIDVDEGGELYVILRIFYRTARGRTEGTGNAEIEITSDSDGFYTNSEDLTRGLYSRPLGNGDYSILLATITKGTDWNIINPNIKNENLLEKYATLTIDASKSTFQHFDARDDYTLKVINNKPGSKIRVEVEGYSHGAVEWIGMPRATRILNSLPPVYDTAGVTFEIYTDEDGNLHPTLIPDEKSAQIGWSPIGSIVAWHKNLKKTTNREVGLKLPPGWVECNGQEAYLLDGTKVTVPRLNNSTYSTSPRGFFLRGHTKSGLLEQDALERHTHIYNEPSYQREKIVGTSFDHRRTYSYVKSSSSTSYGYRGRFSSETRPINMSVVWIMRIF